MTTTSTLVVLAQTILRETEKLDAYLKESGNAQPSFDYDAPLHFPKLPEEVQKARQEVLRATKELEDLVVGPTEGVRWMAGTHFDSLSFHAIHRFGIAKAFPIDSTATFGEIAKAVNVDETNVRRLMRHAMTNRIFKEVSPGLVAHTPASRVLAEDEHMDSWVGFCMNDVWPAAAKTVDAMQLNPSCSEPTQTGFNLAFNTLDVEPMFVTIGKDPQRAKRFGAAMKSLTGGEGYEVRHVVDNYDWDSINARGGLMVDLGGSHGFVCVDLAKKFADMRFVVQDLPKTVASAPDLGELGDRITFMVHDFHTAQPVKDADVYFFRWIFHNHSDKYALNMLRQLIPALKKGARIVINDYCLPEPKTESWRDEKTIRTMDLTMLTLLNAQERTKGEFETLFQTTDPGFKFLGVTRPRDCRMSIIEAVWEGEDYGGQKKDSVATPN